MSVTGSSFVNARVEPVARLVEAAFPGILLESQVQGWVYLEEFEEGVAAFQEIVDPQPADYRWIGVCYYQLLKDDEALESLNKAVKLGNEGARVNLAHLLPFLERGDEAKDLLAGVNLHSLSPYDKALYYRVLSLQEENSGNLRAALQAAENAWKRIQGLPEYPILAPSVLAQLAVIYGRIGRSQRALWFLERGMYSTSGIEKIKVRLRRASVLAGLGRQHEARLELQSPDMESAPLTCQGERNYLLGEISLAQGNPKDAIQKYNHAVSLATKLGFNYEELLSRLALVTILGSRKDFAGATEHITRAQELISDKADRLSFRFREVLLMLWQQRYTPAHALEELEDLIEMFGEMGLLQEQAAVRLHRADLLRILGRPYESELDELHALSITLQNPSLLAREWTFLPDLQKIAQRTHPRIAGTTASVIEVHTLGEEKVLLNDDLVHIPLRRGVEVLAYLLERKAVTLQDVMDNVFPNEKASSAKSYFHQFRHQLREHIDGLEIEYDAESKMYRLTSEINVLWDVAELRAGRRMGKDGGTFLPSSTNGWVQAIREAITTLAEPEAEPGDAEGEQVAGTNSEANSLETSEPSAAETY